MKQKLLSPTSAVCSGLHRLLDALSSAALQHGLRFPAALMGPQQHAVPRDRHAALQLSAGTRLPGVKNNTVVHQHGWSLPRVSPSSTAWRGNGPCTQWPGFVWGCGGEELQGGEKCYMRTAVAPLLNLCSFEEGLGILHVFFLLYISFIVV